MYFAICYVMGINSFKNSFIHICSPFISLIGYFAKFATSYKNIQHSITQEDKIHGSNSLSHKSFELANVEFAMLMKPTQISVIV